MNRYQIALGKKPKPQKLLELDETAHHIESIVMKGLGLTKPNKNGDAFPSAWGIDYGNKDSSAAIAHYHALSGRQQIYGEFQREINADILEQWFGALNEPLTNSSRKDSSAREAAL